MSTGIQVSQPDLRGHSWNNWNESLLVELYLLVHDSPEKLWMRSKRQYSAHRCWRRYFWFCESPAPDHLIRLIIFVALLWGISLWCWHRTWKNTFFRCYRVCDIHGFWPGGFGTQMPLSLQSPVFLYQNQNYLINFYDFYLTAMYCWCVICWLLVVLMSWNKTWQGRRLMMMDRENRVCGRWQETSISGVGGRNLPTIKPLPQLLTP